MFGFLGKGRDKGREGKPIGGSDSPATQMQFTSPAAAALAAAASANLSTKSAGPQPTGRVLRGKDVTVDLDLLRSEEVVKELQVQPITLLKFEYKLEHTQQVASNSSYICYGLKPGHIRALNRNTASRALFKGHPTSLSHMAFFNSNTSLLASASRSGDVTVRLVTDGLGPDGDVVPTETIMLTAQLAMPADAAASNQLVTLAWHPTTPQILAAAAGGSVYIFQVPTEPPAEQPPAPVAPGIQYSLPGTGAAITAVEFSLAGDLLVVADNAGYVHAWWLEGEEEPDGPLLTWRPFDNAAAVASVKFLHQASDGSSLLVTGDARNAAVKLWVLPAAAAAAGGAPRCLQSVAFTASKAAGAVFCHLAVQPALQLVILANTVRKQVYTLHYRLGRSAASGPETALFDYAAFFGVKQPILSLTTALEAVESQIVPGTVQPQQLLLYTVQTDAIQQYVVNPSLCSDTAEEALVSEDEVDVEEGEEVGSRAAEQAEAAAETAAVNAGAAAPEAAADIEAPVAAAVPPPAHLPTPGKLLHMTADQEAAAAAVADAAAARPADSVIVNGTKEAAQDMNAAPAAEATVNSEADADSTAPELPLPSAAAIPAAAEETASSADKAEEGEIEADEEAGEVSSSAAAPAGAPLPPMPTTSLLHSAEKAPVPTLATDSADVTAAPQQASEVAPAAVAAVPSAELAALQQQMQQLLAMQQGLAAQLQANSQQTTQGVRSELGRALKSTEASLAKQLDGSIKAANKKAEDDRRKGAAKERAELERIISTQLGQVVTVLQRDLLKSLAEAAREQSRNTVTAVVNSVSSVVSQSVATTLQRELVGGAAGSHLQAALERSLANSLAQPLHEALRENFAQSIIPAFERATQVMFGQVEGAFTSWLADSSRTVSAAQSDAASSLNSSLQQLQAVVGTIRGELADTSRSLNRIASSTASRAAEASSGGGAGHHSVSQLEAATAAAADPRVEIGALLGVRKYEEALVKALNTASLDVLLWACKQVDPALVLGGSSVSQTTLLSLVHQLSVDLKNDANTPIKLTWLTEAAPVVDPHDPVTAPHLKGVLTGVMNSLKQLVNSLPSNDATAKKGRVTLHLFNSLMHQ